MFSQLPKKDRYDARGRRIVSRATSVAGMLYEQALHHTCTVRGSWPEFRPSSFPICGLHVFKRLLEGCSKGAFLHSESGSGAFFCGEGHHSHRGTQFHMGFSGRLFGDWICGNPTCKEHYQFKDNGVLTRRNSVDNECPTCQEGMQYVEKEIRYIGLRGHIDGLILLDDGSFWVVDYKTTTRNVVENTALPKNAHLLQLLTYCYVLVRKYKFKVAGFSLLYITRDNPFNFKECSEAWTSDWYKFARATIKREKQKYMDGLRAFVHLDLTEMLDNKQCSSREFYDKNICYYNTCPMLDVCFDRRKLEQNLKEHISNNPTQKRSRVLLAKKIHSRMHD